MVAYAAIPRKYMSPCEFCRFNLCWPLPKDVADEPMPHPDFRAICKYWHSVYVGYLPLPSGGMYMIGETVLLFRLIQNRSVIGIDAHVALTSNRASLHVPRPTCIVYLPT